MNNNTNQMNNGHGKEKLCKTVHRNREGTD